MLKDVGVNAPTTECSEGGGTHEFPGRAECLHGTGVAESRSGFAGRWPKQLSECLEKAPAPNTKYTFPHVVRMDFASGDSLGISPLNREQFKQMMTNPQFAQQLGMIMAGDAYTGNGDRLMSMNKVENFEQQMMPGGAARAGRLGITQATSSSKAKAENLKLKAIDNATHPGMKPVRWQASGATTQGCCNTAVSRPPTRRSSSVSCSPSRNSMGRRSRASSCESARTAPASIKTLQKARVK